MCFGMAPSAAFALDWALRSTQTETVELNDNQFLRTSPAVSLGSYSTLTANAEARTPISRFTFDGDGTYRKYWGPGVDGVPSENLSYGFKARYELNEKNSFDREFVEAAWRQSSTAFALLGQLGVLVNTAGYLDTLTAAGGIDRSITARDTISLFATSTRTSYEPSSGGTPLTDTLARGSWRHSVSSNLRLNASSEYELINYENASNSQVEIYRNQVGVDVTLSPVLSFRGNIGAIHLVIAGGIVPFATVGSSSALGPAGSSSTGTVALTDWIGDAALTYRLYKSTTLTITANQSVGPSLVGSLFKTDSITASLTHAINARSNLSFSANATRSISSTSSDFVSASATYGYNFTPTLSAQLTYRYLHRFANTSGGSTIDPLTGTPTVSGTGAVSSNSVMLVVSNSSILLPRGN